MGKTRLEALDDGVRLLTLTDPDKRNAMGEQMGAEVLQAAADVGQDAQARVLVVTGEGTAFCAGADLPALFGDRERPTADTHDALRGYYRAFLAIHELPLPSVAAVNGPAVGAGLNLAMACDVRVAGREASFGATFARIGLHPGGGCTWFLVQALGSSRALRILVAGDTLDASQAVALGLADGPEEDALGAALEIARTLARTDPRLARNIKRGVRLASGGASLDAILEYETWAQAASASSPQLHEWVTRFGG